jgi:hypothetical protein
MRIARSGIIYHQIVPFLCTKQWTIANAGTAQAFSHKTTDI